MPDKYIEDWKYSLENHACLWGILKLLVGWLNRIFPDCRSLHLLKKYLFSICGPGHFGLNCFLSFYIWLNGKITSCLHLINHDGVITDLEPDLLECEVKWALESITMNKASEGDGIPVELFQILKDDAVKVLHSICQQIWKTQQWP